MKPDSVYASEVYAQDGTLLNLRAKIRLPTAQANIIKSAGILPFIDTTK